MNRKIVVTVVGPDRPGIVENLTGFLAQRGLNLEDSRMAVLGGEFAGILLVAGEEKDGAGFEALIPEMESLTGTTITTRETAKSVTGKPGIPFLVHGYAMDHPGIVHALAQEIAALGANIEEMETGTHPAPVTGTPLFDVRMRISLPVEVSITELRNRLGDAGERQNIDVKVEPCVP
jgi:glycine cleavage system transcriptional repressor